MLGKGRQRLREKNQRERRHGESLTPDSAFPVRAGGKEPKDHRGDDAAAQPDHACGPPGQERLPWIARRPSKQVGLARNHDQSDGGKDVHDEVQPEDLERAHRQREVGHDRRQHDADRRETAEKEEVNGATDIRVDPAPFGDGCRQRAVVSARDDEVGGFAGHVGSTTADGDADVGGLERRRVIDAVAGHRDDVARRLESADDGEFVLGRDTREDCGLAQVLPSPLADELSELARIDAEICRAGDLELARHRHRGPFLVSRDHDGADSGAAQLGDGIAHASPGRVLEAGQAYPRQLRLRRLRLPVGFEAPKGERQ